MKIVLNNWTHLEITLTRLSHPRMNLLEALYTITPIKDENYVIFLHTLVRLFLVFSVANMLFHVAEMFQTQETRFPRRKVSLEVWKVAKSL